MSEHDVEFEELTDLLPAVNYPRNIAYTCVCGWSAIVNINSPIEHRAILRLHTTPPVDAVTGDPMSDRDALARVLSLHLADEGLNECSCGTWEHWEDPYDMRGASFGGHLADVALAFLRGEGA